MRLRRSRGFTLIELLIVVAVIGIIAAIALPNLLNAINRGKQKRTMADLRQLATAIEQYSIDNTIYPTAATPAQLSPHITPVYLETMIIQDAWNRDFIVDSVDVEYTIGSGGMDGGALNIIGGPTSNLTDAIIYANGQFFQWPDGTQR
jgi:type II secretion system protein G